MASLLEWQQQRSKGIGFLKSAAYTEAITVFMSMLTHVENNSEIYAHLR